MTVFGKVMVFFTVALSFMLAAAAFAVWKHRIDFSGNRATAEQLAGRYAERESELNDLWPRVAPAEYSWRAARKDVQTQEDRRLDDRNWYLAELAHLRNKATAADAVRVVIYADRDDEKAGVRKGQVLLDPRTLRPVMAPVKDAAGGGVQSLAAYDAEEQRTLASLDAVQTKFEEQSKAATALTERLIGPKGLQQRLIDERQKRDDVLEEEKLVRPLLVNSVVESELILKRHRALLRRIEELKGTGVATRDRGE